jgi:hypothetical protein
MKRREQATLRRAVTVERERRRIELRDIVGQLCLQEGDGIRALHANPAKFVEPYQHGAMQHGVDFGGRSCEGAERGRQVQGFQHTFKVRSIRRLS